MKKVTYKTAAESSPQAPQGVVHHYVQGSLGSRVAEDSYDSAVMVETLRIGLPVWELDDLQASLEVPREKLAPLLGISRATLHRRLAGGRLGTNESDRVVRFAKLLGRAIEVMESPENARRWLNAPQLGLGGAVPLEFARTEVGAREVEDLLGRIEHGVYS